MALQQPSGISPNHDRAVPDSDAAIFAQRTSRRIARRLLPFLFVLYTPHRLWPGRMPRVWGAFRACEA